MVKIAIFYTLAGGGHISLACSAKDALTKYASKKATIQLFDPFPESFASTHKALINHFLDVYRLGYKVTDNPQIETTIRRLTDLAIKSNLLKFCKKYKPDIVIANHPLIAAILPKLQEKCPPFLSVVHFADPYTTHQSWFFNKSATMYLSPTPEMTQQAIASGIPQLRIKTIGWLLRDQFYSAHLSPAITKKALGLDLQKPTIFIGGTGQGSSDMYDICSYLAESPKSANLQIIVNPGLNADLVEKLLDLVHQHTDLFYLIPYIKNMPEILNCCDLVVGKAGPNFMFETLTIGKPLLVTSYLPGQENGNIDFIKNNELGWVVLDPKAAAQKIFSLVASPTDLRQKSSAATKIRNRHKHAPQDFVQEIIALTNRVQNSTPT